MFVPCFFEPLLQQSNPGLVNINTKAGAETVTENKDRRWLVSLDIGRNYQNNKSKNS